MRIGFTELRLTAHGGLPVWTRFTTEIDCATIATVRSLDVVLPVRTTDVVTELRLRIVARPERRVADCCITWGVELPAGTRAVENVVAKTAV